jgi:hypothetical protein
MQKDISRYVCNHVIDHFYLSSCKRLIYTQFHTFFRDVEDEGMISSTEVSEHDGFEINVMEEKVSV